jgi:hypothetical protein
VDFLRTGPTMQQAARWALVDTDDFFYAPLRLHSASGEATNPCRELRRQVSASCSLPDESLSRDTAASKRAVPAYPTA